MNNKLSNAFSIGIRPEQRLEIVEWAKKNVYLPQSKKSDRADMTLTPWLIEPLQTVIDNTYDNIVLVAPTGAGKSTLMEILACYTVLEKPGPIGVFTQSAPTAQSWMETRLLPTLQKNPNIKNLFPSDRHKVKRESILFPHMPLFVRGPSISNLQSLSLDAVILDECFLLDDGTIDYAKKRYG
jgi:phage terminase large subunit GpA-like protein